MGIEGMLEGISSCQREIACWQARQMRLLAEYACLTEGDEFAAEEIAALVKWPSWRAQEQLMEARELVSRLPATVDALEKGEIDSYKARVLYDLTSPLSADKVAEVEALALEKAPEQTGAQMRQRTRRIVMRVDPEGVRERAEAKKAERVAGMQAEEDDMAKLWAILPADKAVTAAQRVDKLARAAKTPGDTRTLNQRRADVVADLLLATPDGASPVKVHLYVTVSSTMLMGLDDQPGELVGYGPISADLSRELAGDATWQRLLTDPVSGKLLDFGTKTYRPPAALRKFLWARDSTCRFPGCMMPAQRSEIDHTTPFPQGATADHNCGPYCKRHHRAKHRSGWQVTQPTPGTFHHRSPTGKIYIREAEPVLIREAEPVLMG